jgi:hypothetical protein
MIKFYMKETQGFIEYLWWKLVPGTTTVVPWPQEKWLTIHDDIYGKVDVQTNDPNHHYRPYLEKNVGKQGIDWNWKISSFSGDLLAIKFRKGKEKWASIITIMWV